MQIHETDFFGMCAVLEETSVSKTVDISVAFLHVGTHPTRGSVIVVSSTGDRQAIITH